MPIRGTPFTRFVALLSLLLPLVSLTGGAHAQQQPLEDTSTRTTRSEEARRLFLRGVEHAKKKEWSLALESFEWSRALESRPNTIFNIAAALLRLGRAGEALAAFESYLTSVQGVGRPDTQKLIDEAKGMLVTLELSVEPDDAEVLLDGKATMGSGALRRLTVDPGEHKIQVQAAGFLSMIFNVAGTAGTTQKKTFALLPEKPGSEPPLPAVTPLPTAPQTVIAEPETSGGSFFSRPLFWIIAGAALVGGGVALGFVIGSSTADPYGGSIGVVVEGQRSEMRP